MSLSCRQTAVKCALRRTGAIAALAVATGVALLGPTNPAGHPKIARAIAATSDVRHPANVQLPRIGFPRATWPRARFPRVNHPNVRMAHRPGHVPPRAR